MSPERLWGWNGTIHEMPFRMLVHSYVNYQINPNVLLYLSANNLLNQTTPQTPYGDPGRRLVQAGIKFNL